MHQDIKKVLNEEQAKKFEKIIKKRGMFHSGKVHKRKGPGGRRKYE